MIFFLQITFSSNYVKLDLEKLLDPDPHKMNEDPQPCNKLIQQYQDKKIKEVKL